jgi:hypothetical protein
LARVEKTKAAGLGATEKLFITLCSEFAQNFVILYIVQNLIIILSFLGAAQVQKRKGILVGSSFKNSYRGTATSSPAALQPALLFVVKSTCKLTIFFVGKFTYRSGKSHIIRASFSELAKNFVLLTTTQPSQTSQL